MRKILIVLLMSGLLGSMLTGCAKKQSSSENDGSSQYGAQDKVRFYGADSSNEGGGQLMAKDTYYFGYDRYDLDDEDTLSINSHANKLTHNGGNARIEGHTDERGSREYNVALGERRAKAIANVLMLKGVDQNQVSVVSYGSEKPAKTGHDESAWSKNRRGVVAYE